MICKDSSNGVRALKRCGGGIDSRTASSCFVLDGSVCNGYQSSSSTGSHHWADLAAVVVSGGSRVASGARVKTQSLRRALSAGGSLAQLTVLPLGGTQVSPSFVGYTKVRWPAPGGFFMPH